LKTAADFLPTPTENTRIAGLPCCPLRLWMQLPVGLRRGRFLWFGWARLRPLIADKPGRSENKHALLQISEKPCKICPIRFEITPTVPLLTFAPSVSHPMIETTCSR